MTNQEINEYLAENLFGLIRGKDFDYWDNRFAQAGLGGNIPSKNYISNYQQVLEQLILILDKHNQYFSAFRYGIDEDIYCFQIITDKINGKSIEGYGSMLGESVCRATIDYLRELRLENPIEW